MIYKRMALFNLRSFVGKKYWVMHCFKSINNLFRQVGQIYVKFRESYLDKCTVKNNDSM